MDSEQIIKKVEEMVIAKDPHLADKEYRKRLPPSEKNALIASMIILGKKLEVVNSF